MSTDQTAADVIAEVLGQEMYAPHFDAGRVLSALYTAGFAVVKKPCHGVNEAGTATWETDRIYAELTPGELILWDRTVVDASDLRALAGIYLAAADLDEVMTDA